MVWLHGGGVSVGNGTMYDPTRMAVEGDVIVVTVNLRLNIFGFFGYAGLEGSGTFGLLDEQAALAWVQRNIAVFGGDRNNVTLFGESGGAVRTCAHLLSPGSRGLFHKAILQSGTCAGHSPLHAVGLNSPPSTFGVPLRELETIGADSAVRLGCPSPEHPDVVECLRGLPMERILGERESFGNVAFDTRVLPTRPSTAIDTGQFHHVPVISGFTRDEARAVASGIEIQAFLEALKAGRPFEGHPINEQRYPELIQEAFGDRAVEVLALYPVSKYSQPALAWSAVYTDLGVCGQLAETRVFARQMPTHSYEFADPNGVGLVPFLPDLPSGASHSSELPLLFDIPNVPWDLAAVRQKPLSEQQKALGRLMIQYWTQFARTGNPNSHRTPRWPLFKPEGARTQVLAPAPAGISRIQADVEHQCAFWEPLLEEWR